MTTTTIDARCNARPTRLAFILASPDKDQLQAVFARASTLWGGVFNSIVILDDSKRTTAGIHYTGLPEEPYLKQQSDLLKAFDPDLLITYSKDNLPKELMAWKHRCFPSSNLDWNPWGKNEESYFVDIFPLLHDLWEKEFKGFENPRVTVKYIEKAEAEKSLLLAARFGRYSSDDYYEFLRREFRAESLAYDAASRSSHWPGNFQTIIGLTSHFCRPTRQRHHSHAFFLLNPDDSFDVVDYWNLRAAGMYLLPLTLDTYQECAVPIKDFAAASAYPINEQVTNMPTLIKAASIMDEQQQEVTKWISNQKLVKEISMQGWVPRYRRKEPRVANELDIEPVSGIERTAMGVLIDGYGKVEGPVPPFLSRDDFSEHWSMDLDFHTFGMPNACYHMPWLNSGCDALAGRRIEMEFGMDATRVSRSAIVAPFDGNSGDVRIAPVRAEEVVKAFLEGVGIEYVDTSSPGLALTRIIEMMEGFHRCDMFRNEAIRQTLDELASGDHRLVRVVQRTVMESLCSLRRFGKPATQSEKGEQRDRILSQAVDAGVFRVGLVFQCSRCRRHHWYAVTEFDKQYSCKSCFSREVTPRLDCTEWHYASDGLFRSTNKLDGNMAIILALAFFNAVFDQDVRFASSFDYKLAGDSHEMDFAVFTKERFRGEIETIFGESKSGGSLTAEEQKKLKTFGEKTGAYICFCTFKEDFSDDDKIFFRDLYESGIRLILLPRFFLEMDSHDVLEHKHEHRRVFGGTTPDWLMRTTIIRTLGNDFAKKHHIWV